MGSKRLPKKSLFKLGRERVIERCYKSASYHKVFDKVIVATSTTKDDDELCDYLNYNNFLFFRGDLENVLSRFQDISVENNAKNIVRLTGDNPLIDPFIIRDVFKFHEYNNFDYTSNIINRNFPRGNDVECINAKVLNSLKYEDLKKEDKEHVTLFIRKNIDKYNVGIFKNKEKLFKPEARLTIDYQEDYELITKIYQELHLDSKINNFKEIDIFLNENPDLLKINEHVEQKKISDKIW